MTHRSSGLRFAACLVLVSMVTSCAKSDHRTTPLPPSCPGGRGTDLGINRGEQRVLVHLPACYDDHPDRRYPVVVVVHGVGADQTQWTDIGLTTSADRLAASGEIGAAILIAPDFGDSPAERETQLVVDDVVPWVDRTFRTLADPAHRVIGGISRGGGAALLAAATRPDLFGAVAAHSPTVVGDDKMLRDGLTALSGNIRIDVGNRDRLRGSVVGFADSLKKVGIAAELVIRPGHHDRAYWRSQVPDYLRFYAGRWR